MCVAKLIKKTANTQVNNIREGETLQQIPVMLRKTQRHSLKPIPLDWKAEKKIENVKRIEISDLKVSYHQQ